METIRTPRRQVDLIHGPIFKNLFIFAIPIFIFPTCSSSCTTRRTP